VQAQLMRRALFLTLAVNEQEIQRNPSTVNGVTIEAVSSNVDDKTMHETYLWPFANAVRAGTSAVMCSYQRINGSYGTRLEHLHPDPS
jgi:beta-glucosidase